ncbi:MAG: UTP--glucose-1-phosphate uridylyltransferase GalU [Propionivibrio sp.]
MSKVKKAVFPVAGLGTRFLPATKASPKEMLPIVDKPLIQYAVEEAVAAGIEEMIFITGRSKRAIEDHFDKAYELENELALKNKTALLEEVRNLLPKSIKCIYIRQPEALGLGHAVLCARPAIGDEPFAVLLADDLLDGEPPVMQQMADVFAQEQCSLLAGMNVPLAETASYGIVGSTALDDRLERIERIVEKPAPEKAPSTLAVVGRYILTPRIFYHLENVRPGSGGEIQLTDAIAALLAEERVLAYRYRGTRFDCGSKIGYLQATIEFARRHPEVGAAFNTYLKTLELA